MTTRRTLVIGYDGPRSGHALYCRTFVEALRLRGEDVALHSRGEMPEGLATKVPVLRHADRLLRSLAHAAGCVRAIGTTNPSLIHFQLVTPLVDQLWIPAVSKGRSSVLTVHNVEPHERTLAMSPAALGRIMRAAEALIVHSQANRRRLGALYPDVADRIEVIPHGVWPIAKRVPKIEARRALGLDDRRPTMLFFGAIRRNKGLALLLEALPRIRASLGEAPCLLVAGMPRRPEGFGPYEALIDKLRVRDLVQTRLSYINEADVGLYYGASDLVALPYDETFQAQSGVLIDAYAYAVPVVSTAVGGITETVEDDGTGLVVRQRSPEAFADKVATLLSNESLRCDMSARMRALASGRYSWSNVATKTQELYARLSPRGRV